MISFLLFSSSLLNFAFYIYAIGFVVALGLEQVLKFRPLSIDSSMNERNMFIVQTNRKYLWRQTWVININWFLCNIGLYILSRNMQPMGDNFWSEGLLRKKKRESMQRVEKNIFVSFIVSLHQWL